MKQNSLRVFQSSFLILEIERDFNATSLWSRGLKDWEAWMKKIWCYLRQEWDKGLLEYAVVIAFMVIIVTSIVDMLNMTSKNLSPISNTPSSFAQESANKQDL